MNELALFAGAGGGILGGLLLGWRTVCAVEFDEHARNVLVARQNDGSLEPFPIWDDVRSFDGKPWRGIVDVVSGGFPCQDISTAKGAGAKGIDGEKSGLWKDMSRIIGEVRPRFAFVENSAALTFRGLERVLGDLAMLGYGVMYGVFSAADVGARHERSRIWIIGMRRHSDQIAAFEKCRIYGWSYSESIRDGEIYGNDTSSRMVRKSDGLADWMDRHARIGNGQVPGVVQKAWHVLCQEIGPKKE